MTQKVEIVEPRDRSTYAIESIGYEHHEIHAGSHYFITGYELEGSGGTIEFVLTTPNTTKWLHLLFLVVSQEEMTLEGYEGTTGVVGGTTLTPVNNNRNSSNTSGATIVKDPTSISGDGTLITSWRVGTTGPGSNIGGSGMVNRNDELVLKQNETYLFRITSNAADNYISFKATWYEHTDKE